MLDDLTNNILVLGLNLAQASQASATMNVSNYQVSGAEKVGVSFQSRLAAMKQLENKEALEAEVQNLLQLKPTELLVSRGEESIDLAEETMKSLQAEGRYKAMVDILNHRIGMLELGVKGR